MVAARRCERSKLHYYARRFYDDLLVSPCQENGTLSSYVVSDKVKASAAALRLRVMDFQGKTLLEKRRTSPCELSRRVYSVENRQEEWRCEYGSRLR